jgi:hypothetical protein
MCGRKFKSVGALQQAPAWRHLRAAVIFSTFWAAQAYRLDAFSPAGRTSPE